MILSPDLLENIPALPIKMTQNSTENSRIKRVLQKNGFQNILWVESSRELLKITGCLSHNNKRKSKISKKKSSDWVL